MKKLLIISLMMLSTGIISCKKEAIQIIKEQEQSAIQMSDRPGYIDLGSYVFGRCDNWTITNFRLNGVDATDEFSSFRFEFCPENGILAYNDIMSFPGRWYFIIADGGRPSLMLNFKGADPEPDRMLRGIWGNLEGKWDVRRISYDYISLNMSRNERDVRDMVIERVTRQP